MFYVLIFFSVNVNCTKLISDILLFHMENILTSLDIRNPGLRTLPPGVEIYFVRGGGISVLEVLQKIN